MKKLIALLVLSLLIVPVVTQAAAWNAEQLQELGVKMIDTRVKSVTKYDGFLSQTKNISDKTLGKVRGELSRVKTELDTELKPKIQKETDIAVLKEDVKSIVDKYRVYQVFLTQSAGVVAVDRLITFQQKLYDLKDKVAEKADELEEAGKDVSNIRSLISSADTQISNASTDIMGAESKFSSMQISNPEVARNLKLEGRGSLIDARENFSKARTNLRDAVSQIKELISE